MRDTWVEEETLLPEIADKILCCHSLRLLFSLFWMPFLFGYICIWVTYLDFIISFYDCYPAVEDDHCTGRWRCLILLLSYIKNDYSKGHYCVRASIMYHKYQQKDFKTNKSPFLVTNICIIFSIMSKFCKLISILKAQIIQTQLLYCYKPQFQCFHQHGDID